MNGQAPKTRGHGCTTTMFSASSGLLSSASPPSRAKIRTGRWGLVDVGSSQAVAALVHMPSGACSRAEAKGGGAPTGMSATAAVAGRPKYTPPAYGQGVPGAFRQDLNPEDAGTCHN